VTDLKVVTKPHGSGYRYAIKNGGHVLLVSGLFQNEEDARHCGDHIAGDPAALFDFLKR
jgi:hypothetical protein